MSRPPRHSLGRRKGVQRVVFAALFIAPTRHAYLVRPSRHAGARGHVLGKVPRAGLVGAIGLALLALAGLATYAWASFSSYGQGIGAARVTTLGTPTIVSASQDDPPAAGSQAALSSSTLTSDPQAPALVVSWTGVTFPGSGTQGYYVERYLQGNPAPAPACGTSPSTLLPSSQTSCVDSGLDPGATYQYQVTAVYDSWSSASTLSNPVTVAASVLTSFSFSPSTYAPITGTAFTVVLS
ncbi:MAG TPA: fibronectin type III domain-containing protein, partial [Acidimicrobiales bacterium]|nr:fibronectin type III domain-containing protein [Acidimicrobiales bacterium]